MCIDQIEGMINESVKVAVKDVSERHEFIINKLVAAVDAEFTLMTNRIKVLEAALKEHGVMSNE